MAAFDVLHQRGHVVGHAEQHIARVAELDVHAIEHAGGATSAERYMAFAARPRT
jgi:hypothetical protein